MLFRSVSEDLQLYLNSSCNSTLCVQLMDYDNVRENLREYVSSPEVKVWIGTEYTNYALFELISPQVRPMAPNELRKVR